MTCVEAIRLQQERGLTVETRELVLRRIVDLGGSPQHEGVYDQIRLIVSGGEIVVDGQSFPLTIPSGAETGLKLHYMFELAADVQTTITIDFDANASVVETGAGAYLLMPVLTVQGREDAPLR